MLHKSLGVIAGLVLPVASAAAIADGKVLATLIDGTAVHEDEGLPKPITP